MIEISIVSERMRIRVADLAENPGRLLGTDAASACLHYCAPTHGGWGVIRTAMLLPEMYMLFVCPAACGRHGAIAAIEHGCKERVGYLCIEEHEIVLGSYENAIRDTVPQLMAQLDPKPSAMIIVVSCIDDLLGTHYEQMMAEFEAGFGIPFRLGRMNPISQGGTLPPGKRIQRDMYDFLDGSVPCDNGVNLLGPFLPLSGESELHVLLREAGMGPVRHVSHYDRFKDFQAMGAAALNLVARPEGLAAAENLEEKLGIPYVVAPVAFSEEGIGARYAAIGAAAGVSFDIDRHLDNMHASARQALAKVGARTISIDAGATCSPFDLARCLCEAGFSVCEVFAEHLHEYERSSFDWLTRHVPDLHVSSPIHHKNAGLRPTRPTADIAIGFTAAYLSGAPMIAPISFDEGLYGCHGTTMIHRALENAVASGGEQHLESIVREYGLVA